MEFISLKFDHAFRALLAHEGVRKRFISDVTGIPLESIRYTRLDNPFLLRHRRWQKQGILDVAVRLHDGTKIDIELSKPFENAGAAGEWIQLFNVESEEELDMIRTENAGILEAREILKRLILKNPLRQLYEQHLKEVRDRKAEDAYVRDLGRAEREIELICRKLAKGKSPEVIAEDLEENLSEVKRICDVAAKYAPDYNTEKIMMELEVK